MLLGAGGREPEGAEVSSHTLTLVSRMAPPPIPASMWGSVKNMLYGAGATCTILKPFFFGGS